MAVHLTPSERKVLKILSDVGRPINTYSIVYEMYGGDPPEHARIWVGQLIRSLVKKAPRLKKNDMPVVCYSGRKGPRPMQAWVER